MGKPYSEDLRERAVEAVEAGVSRHAAAARFKVSVSSVVRWVQRWRTQGEIAAKPCGGSTSPLEDHEAAVLALSAEKPDLTLDELCAELAERKITTSRVALWRFFRRHGLSFKKNRARQRAAARRRGRGPRTLAAGSALV
jgi:transposase